MCKSKEKKERVEEQSVGAAMVKELEALNVSENPEKSSPIIGYFSSGFDPLKNSENPQSKLGGCSSVKIFRLEPRIARQEEVENEIEMQDAAMDSDTTSTYATMTYIRKDKKRKTLRETRVAKAGNSRNIPPHDLEALTQEEAYPLDMIILKGEWNYLQDIFELVQGGSESELAPDVYPTFVCKRIGNLQRAKDEYSKRRIGGILSYITHLIKFKDLHSSIHGVSSHNLLPPVLFQRFSTMFTPNEKNTDDKLNLLISYVLVLSLFADNFCSDPSDIAKDLRMNPFALGTHYENLGCQFVYKNRLRLQTLPVPLTFRTSIRKRRRRA